MRFCLTFGWTILWLAHAGAWGQEPAGMMKLQIGDQPVQILYEKHEVTNWDKPDETHRISGNPVSVTAYLEGHQVVLEAPYLTYSEGVFRATSGVAITDGTLSVEAREGRFDTAGKEAHFQGDVKWARRQTSGRTSRGENEYITLRFGPNGVEHILFGAGPKEPGRMFLFPEGGAMGAIRPREDERSPLPEPPQIDRALSPLEN